MADGAFLCRGAAWCMILWFIGWPIAWACAAVYLLLQPFTVCIEDLKVIIDIFEMLSFFGRNLFNCSNFISIDSFLFLFQGVTDFLVKGIQLPHICATYMMQGTPVTLGAVRDAVK